MSTMPPTPEGSDPLLAALRHLPVHRGDGPHDARRRREAQRAYLRSFERPSWRRSMALATAGRAAVPVFLATAVALYMSWAIGAAAALMH